MIYSIELTDVKGYGLLLFAKNVSTNAVKIVKSMNYNYSQKFIVHAQKYTTDAMKTASKKQFKKIKKQLMMQLVIKLLKK